MMSPEPDKQQGKAIDDYYDCRKSEDCPCGCDCVGYCDCTWRSQLEEAKEILK